jgi:DNA-directed RNA polymerase subunit RPC12/RpoP
MENALRNWKCRNCGRTNRTEVALDGTAKCEHCGYLMSIQPSRVRNGQVLPAVYPTRRGSPGKRLPFISST